MSKWLARTYPFATPPPITGTTPWPPHLSRWRSPSTPSNVSTGLVVALVGRAIAGVVLILLVLGLLFICFKKKRRRRDEEDYHGQLPPPPGPRHGVYGGQQYHCQQNPPFRADNVTYPNPSAAPVPSRPQLSPGYFSTTSNSTTEPPPFVDFRRDSKATHVQQAFEVTAQ